MCDRKDLELNTSSDTVGKRRYSTKLQLLALSDDPYVIRSDAYQFNPDVWPSVEYPDVFMHLIDFHTIEELRAYKNTEAWAYFKAGCVSDVGLLHINDDTCLALAKVNPMEESTSTPARPWVGVRYNGQVLCAHCSCTEEAGEGCLHIAALLYYLMTKALPQVERAFMSILRKSSERNEVPFAMVRDIDFGPSTDDPYHFGDTDDPADHFGDTDDPDHFRDTDDPDHFRDTDDSDDGEIDVTNQPKVRSPTKSEMDEFLAKLYLVSPRSVIFSVIPPYSDTFKTKP